MNLFLIIILVVVFLGFYLFWRQLKSLEKGLDNKEGQVLVEWLKEMKSSVDKNADVLDKQLQDQRSSLIEQLKNQRDTIDKQTQLIWERLENATKVIGEVQSHLGGLQEFSKDMKDLSNILKSPKLRGGLGEQFLYEILANCLPKDLYRTQHRFRDGTVCDAVVVTEKGIIPIDSKFPMENFKAMIDCETPEDRERAKKAFIRDVKGRIDEISNKYIVPEENTTEQAVMYIPSENVYYELIVNTPQIEEYSKFRNVVMASPNTLSYFLKVVLVAYQKQELDKNANEILKALGGIRVEAARFNEDLNILDGHINRTSKSMDTIKSKFQRLFGKIESVHMLKSSSESEETPLIEDSVEQRLDL